MNSKDKRSDLPTAYDGTQLVVRVRLPDGREWQTSDVYDHVYGLRLNDGAKPWPYYRDADTGEWWSLSVSGDTHIDALVWMIPLDQLKYRPRPEAEAFLEEVLPELESAAEAFGANLRTGMRCARSTRQNGSGCPNARNPRLRGGRPGPRSRRLRLHGSRMVASL